MAPSSPKGTVFEWYVCGLDEVFKGKGIYPSVLATWAAIEYAASNSFRQFDFMGVGKPDVPYGVRDFKKKFGGVVVNHGRYIRINNKSMYLIAEIGYNILSLLKNV
jgi:serine/alanine adding enzyme